MQIKDLMNGQDLVRTLTWMTQISLRLGIWSRSIKLDTSMNGLGFYWVSDIDGPKALTLDSFVKSSKRKCMHQ